MKEKKVQGMALAWHGMSRYVGDKSMEISKEILPISPMAKKVCQVATEMDPSGHAINVINIST